MWEQCCFSFSQDLIPLLKTLKLCCSFSSVGQKFQSFAPITEQTVCPLWKATVAVYWGPCVESSSILLSCNKFKQRRSQTTCCVFIPLKVPLTRPLPESGGTCLGVAYLLLSLLLMLWTAALSLSRLTVEANTVEANAGSRSMTDMWNRQLTGLKLKNFSVFSGFSVASHQIQTETDLSVRFLPPLITTLLSFHSLMLSQRLLISLSICLAHFCT